MIQWIQVASGAFVTILAVVVLVLRLEHRITKIEVNMDWLIKNQPAGCERKDEDVGKIQKVDYERTD